MTKVVFPSFSSEEFQPYEIRQLVSALELRFQALETATQSALFDTTGGLSDEYAPLVHTHTESDITDLDHVSSIFDLDDVSGTASTDDVLIWNGTQFVPGPQTGGGGGATQLSDLTDVNATAPSDNDVLRYDTGTAQWGPEALSATPTSLADLTDTDLTGQAKYDLLYNFDGTNWHDTDGALRWNPDNNYLRFAHAHGINWATNTTGSVELLMFETLGAVTGDPLYSSMQLLAKFEGTDAATAYTEVSQNTAVATFNANAQIDTAQFNFGASSLLLDGTGDYVSFPDIAGYDLAPSGAQDWTIEGFVRFNTLLANPETREFAGQWGAGGNAWHMGFRADGFSTQRVRVRADSAVETATITNTTLATATWYHYVMQRQGNNLYVGFNGFQEFAGVGLFGGAQATSSEPIRIGSFDAVTAADMWDGWIDDVRITIGTARYDLSVSTYTVPTADFPEVATSAGTQTFEVGDPVYPTQIDGLSIALTADTDVTGTLEADHVIAGDPGTEGTGIQINGALYESVLKASDLGGTHQAQFIMHRHSTTLPAAIVGARSNTNDATHAILSDNDVIMGIYAAGWDGVDSYSLSSAIDFQLDGTPGQNDMPGQISFYTAADGTEALLERVRIRADGAFQIVDPGGTDFASFSHDGVDFNTTFSATGDWNISGITTLEITAITHMVGSAHVRDGNEFRINDVLNTSYASWSHAGDDFDTVFTSTVDWDITGLTGEVFIDADLRTSGDLTIGGTTTTINSNTVSIADNIIVLNSDEAGVPSQNAGFEIERGTSTNVSLRWNETLDDWEITYDGATWYGILTDNDVPGGGLIADGTTTNNTLRWSGSAWVENAVVTSDGTDLQLATGAATDATLLLGPTTSSVAGQRGVFEIYNDSGAVVYGSQMSGSSNALTLEGVGANPHLSIAYDYGTIIYTGGANVSWKDSTLTDTSSIKQFIDRFQVTVHPGDRLAISTDVGVQVAGGGYLQVTAGGDLDVRDGGSAIIRDSLDTSYVTMSHDADDLTIAGTGAVDINVTGYTNLQLGAMNIVTSGNVDGVDVSAHAADATIHYTKSSILLDELGDVVETTITSGDLLRWNGSNWVNYADSNYATSGHTHILTSGATDVTATFGELNLLDLAGLTAGWVLSADTAATASWKQLSHTLLSDIGTNAHSVIDTHIADATIHFTEASISIPLSQISDVTATAAEVNLLDLAGLTAGWGLIADTATTASWQQIDHADLANIGSNAHSVIDTHLGLTNEHIDWTVTGAEDIFADRMSSGANMADSVLSRPEITDFGVTHQTLTVSTDAATLDLTLGNSAFVDLQAVTGANLTLTLSNPPASGTFGEATLAVQQHSSSAKGVVWPGTVDWKGASPTLSTTADAIDLFHFETWDAGANWHGTYAIADSVGQTLAGLTDTNITTPADASLLIYDTGTATWRDAVMGTDATIDDVGALTIAADAVTYAKMQNVVANNVFLGNNAGAGAIVDELTGTEATAMLDLFATAATTKGVVPGSNSLGATYYLDGSGAWSVPPGGAASNSYVNHVVTDTDSGYTWAETGTAVASTATDTLDWVSGTDIDIDVDATSDAIRIAFSNASGYITGNETITLSGDVTGTGTTAITTVIPADSVTMDQLVDIATNTFLGRTTAATGTVEILTATQATAMLDLFSTTTTVKGLVPGSNSLGATYFLDGSGAWSVPPGSGTVSGTGTDNYIAVWNGTADIDATGSFLITNALDKTAAEVVTGQWSFSEGGAWTGSLTSGPFTGAADYFVGIQSDTEQDNVELALGVMEATNNLRARFFLSDSDSVFGLQGSASSGIPNFELWVGVTKEMEVSNTLTSFFNTVDITGNLTFNAVTDTVAGIQNQNLVDKAAAESIAGAWTFTTVGTPGAVLISSTAPVFQIDETDAALNAKKWDITSVAGQLRFRAVNDADTGWVNFLTVDRTATDVTSVNIVASDFDVGGAATATTFNGVALTTAGAATNYLDETGSYSVPPGGVADGTVTDNTLRWSGSAWVESAALKVATGATGTVTVAGDLTVSGTTTTINSNTVSIADNIIVLNSDEAGAPTQNAGIEIERGTSANVQFLWDETNDVWGTSEPFRIRNSAAPTTDHATFDHDGTDFNLNFAATNSMTFTGVVNTGGYKFDHGLHSKSGSFQSAGTVQNMDSSADEIIAYMGMTNSGTTAEFGSYNWFSGTYQSLIVNGTSISLRDDNVQIAVVNSSVGLAATTGNKLAFYDAGNTLYGQFQHDGTDANFTFGGTTEVNWSGAPLQMADEQIIRPEITDFGVTHQTLTVTTSAATFDLTLGNSAFVDLQAVAAANLTLTLSNPPVTGTFGEATLAVQQHTTTAKGVVWPGSVTWQGATPTLSSTADAVDLFHFETWDAGTTWYGTYATADSTAVVLALDGLSDVDTTGVATGDLLYKSAGDWLDTAGQMIFTPSTNLDIRDGVQLWVRDGTNGDILKLIESGTEAQIVSNNNNIYLYPQGVSTLDVLTTGLNIAGDVQMDAILGDRLALYNSLDTSTMYGFGIESATLYYKSVGSHRWYINTNADAGVSDYMNLSTSYLTLEDVRVYPNNFLSGSRTTAIRFHSTADVSGVAPYGIGMGPTASGGWVDYSAGTVDSASYGHRFWSNDSIRFAVLGDGTYFTDEVQFRASSMSHSFGALTTSDDITNVLYPHDASFKVDSATQVGTIFIALPTTGFSNSMLNIAVRGYDYANGTGAWKLDLGGYAASSGTTWINTSAVCTGNPPFTRVRFSRNASNEPYILLGTTTDTHQYPQIWVESCSVGFSGQGGFDTGWAITQAASETGYTDIKTHYLLTEHHDNGSTDFDWAFDASTADWNIAGLTGGIVLGSGIDLTMSGSNGVIYADDGAATIPSIASTAATTTGFYWGGANIGVAVSAAQTAQFSSSYMRSMQNIWSDEAVSANAAVADVGQVNQFAFMDVNGGVGRFGSYNYDTPGWQPVDLHGSTADVTSTAGDVNLAPTGGNITLSGATRAGIGGTNFRIEGSTTADYINFNHDDTDLNITHASTTDWNITGLNAINTDSAIKTTDGDLIMQSVQNKVRFQETGLGADLGNSLIRQNGGDVGLWSATDAAPSTVVNNAWIATRGTTTTWADVTVNVPLMLPDSVGFVLGTGSDVTMLWDGSDLEITGAASGQIWNFRDGPVIRLWDGTDSDYFGLQNNGVNLLITEQNLSDIVFPAAGTLGIRMEDNTLDQPIIQDYAIESVAEVVATNAVTLTYSEGPAFEVDLEAATGTVTITISGGPPTGTYGEIIVKVQQDTTASRTITWAGGTFEWPGGTAPTMTAAADAIDIFHFSTWNGGTNWWGSVIQDVK